MNGGTRPRLQLAPLAAIAHLSGGGEKQAIDELLALTRYHTGGPRTELALSALIRGRRETLAEALVFGAISMHA
ncbi:hypothetical protein GCM10010304_76880 [Streptomyces roseoviolaceus]